MNQSIAIVTDSLACLPPEIAREYNISIVPLSFMLNGRVYRDWIDISPSQAYELFLQDPDSFQSSAPSPDEFINVFRDLCNKYASILCITISEKLSTTFNVASLAAKQVMGENPGSKIRVLDSMTTTAAEGFVALAAARAAASGKSFDEVTNEAIKVRGKVQMLALLDTIRHVYRSGRIPKIASQVGAVLHVKPVLGILPETSGLVHFSGIVRSRQQGIERLINAIKAYAGNTPIRIAIMHAYAPEEALNLKDRVQKTFNCLEIIMTEFSPLMGYATGTGTVGVAFYKES